jgi:hypothetical protein
MGVNTDNQRYIRFNEVVFMGKYPVEISEEDNAKMKHPFLPTEQYDKVIKTPRGATVLIRYSDKKITKAEIAHMVEINQQVYTRELMA